MRPKQNTDIKNLDRLGDKKAYREAVHRARSAIYIVIALSFIVFVAISAIAIDNEGVANFGATLKSMNMTYYAVALLIIFFSYAIRYFKWSMYLRRLGVKIVATKNYVIYMSMYSMDMTPGRWGRAIVSYTINKLNRVRFARTFPAVVADIFTDFLGFAVVTDSMAIIVGKFVVLSFLLTFLLMVPFFFMYVERPFRYVRKKVWGLRGQFGVLKKLDGIFGTAELYFRHNKKLRGSAFAYSMLITIPSMFLNGMALYFTMLAFGVPLSLSAIPVIELIFSSSIIIGIITGIPAAVGVTDAALVSSLQLYFPGVISLGLAGAKTIFFRIASVWFVQGFGFAALLYTFRYWKD